jgi:hypothetical protein
MGFALREHKILCRGQKTKDDGRRRQHFPADFVTPISHLKTCYYDDVGRGVPQFGDEFLRPGHDRLTPISCVLKRHTGCAQHPHRRSLRYRCTARPLRQAARPDPQPADSHPSGTAGRALRARRMHAPRATPCGHNQHLKLRVAIRTSPPGRDSFTTTLEVP